MTSAVDGVVNVVVVVDRLYIALFSALEQTLRSVFPHKHSYNRSCI